MTWIIPKLSAKMSVLRHGDLWLGPKQLGLQLVKFCKSFEAQLFINVFLVKT